MEDINTVAEKLGYSQTLIRSVARQMELTFVRKKNIPVKSKSNEYAKRIRRMLLEDPALTYTEMGSRLGISRQMVFSITKQHGIEKQNGKMSRRVSQHIQNVLRQVPGDGESLKLFLQRRGVNMGSYQRYIRMNASDPEVQVFLSRFPHSPTKAEKICYYLRHTNMSITDIARRCQVAPQYVCTLNRRKKIRKRRGKEDLPER